MILTDTLKNNVLVAVGQCIHKYRSDILSANRLDLEAYLGGDLAMIDRLKVTDAKVTDMITSLTTVASKRDPIGMTIDSYDHPNGLKVINKTAPFGTIMIIYESRPDVTIEAAAIAFKSGNRIILKGGKESVRSNMILVKCWHEALEQYDLTSSWVTYLKLSRTETQQYLKEQADEMDLIVPRGGEKLIAFVKEHASCPVLVSGRGNNFLYVDKAADIDRAIKIILNGKISKISACNALDKVLIDSGLAESDIFTNQLISELEARKVSVLYGKGLADKGQTIEEAVWYEEFLDYTIVMDKVSGFEAAMTKINKYSGGHSAVIITEDIAAAELFMQTVDCAAVYHNASTRFTDGGEFGMGAELAISTEKMHHRGPLGLEQLVTNKYYVYGNGQVRE